jgi:hypothetical protein
MDNGPPLLLLSLFTAGLTSRLRYDQNRFGSLTWIASSATDIDLQPQTHILAIITERPTVVNKKAPWNP